MVAALAGCASSQPVTQIDKDTYLLVASSRWHGTTAWPQGLQQADDWCRQQGRQRIIGSERSEGVIGVMPKVMPVSNVILFASRPSHGPSRQEPCAGRITPLRRAHKA
jgi:hypothetical protein